MYRAPTLKYLMSSCHRSEDKPAVREISKKLTERKIKPWLDEEQIRPGTLWQTALERQIESIKAAAVFVGENGIGPWQQPEIQAFLNEFVTPVMRCHSGHFAFCQNNARATLYC